MNRDPANSSVAHSTRLPGEVCPCLRRWFPRYRSLSANRVCYHPPPQRRIETLGQSSAVIRVHLWHSTRNGQTHTSSASRSATASGFTWSHRPLRARAVLLCSVHESKRELSPKGSCTSRQRLDFLLHTDAQGNCRLGPSDLLVVRPHKKFAPARVLPRQRQAAPPRSRVVGKPTSGLLDFRESHLDLRTSGCEVCQAWGIRPQLPWMCPRPTVTVHQLVRQRRRSSQSG